MNRSLRLYTVMLLLLICFITFATPSSSFCDVTRFSFTGDVSSTWSSIYATTIEYPRFSAGQSVNGFLYWNSEATPGYHYFPSGVEGQYSVESRDPGGAWGSVYWAEIYVGDSFFNLNQNSWLDIQIGNGTDQDSVHAGRIHTSIYDYRGVRYALDLPQMTLIGNGNILSDSSYPSYLDLSLFDSGSFIFTITAVSYLDPELSGLWPGHYDAGITINISQIDPVPIPPAVWLLGSGLLGLVGLRRRFKNYLNK